MGVLPPLEDGERCWAPEVVESESSTHPGVVSGKPPCCWWAPPRGRDVLLGIPASAHIARSILRAPWPSCAVAAVAFFPGSEPHITHVPCPPAIPTVARAPLLPGPAFLAGYWGHTSLEVPPAAAVAGLDGATPLCVCPCPGRALASDPALEEGAVHLLSIRVSAEPSTCTPRWVEDCLRPRAWPVGISLNLLLLAGCLLNDQKGFLLGWFGILRCPGRLSCQLSPVLAQGPLPVPGRLWVAVHGGSVAGQPAAEREPWGTGWGVP